MQVVGVGSQQDFADARYFLADTGLDDLPLLWEASGGLWRLNGVGTNSAMQLATHDLTNVSGTFFFNDAGRTTVLDASPQSPWGP